MDADLRLPARGLELAADAYGPDDGPPVLLFPGGGQTRHSWGATARLLGDKGWRATTVDLRGHGDSDWAPDGDYSLDAFAGDVRTVARATRRAHGRTPALVGASLGGVASLVAIAEAEDADADPEAEPGGEAPGPERPGAGGAESGKCSVEARAARSEAARAGSMPRRAGAQRRPVARALVLVDVAPRLEPEGVARIGEFMLGHLDGFADLEEVADAVAAYNPHRPRPSDLSGLRKNVRLHDDGRWYWHWDPAFMARDPSADEPRSIRNEARLEDAARALTLPVLLVRGRQSDVLSEAGARHLRSLVPHARSVDVAGAGHMVAGDRNDVFNGAVVGFLEETLPV
jgi:pimeloyl-ACP methyl ester carboxylesterase